MQKQLYHATFELSIKFNLLKQLYQNVLYLSINFDKEMAKIIIPKYDKNDIERANLTHQKRRF